ncbi:hypothetical protein DW903_08245 [Ruminococcus sp. AM42-10AC]|nr:hypothetical protein DW903_08245 [Ruminococcus sp. AM42-10AC]
MALILRNGGSQSPDRWLKEPRNNQFSCFLILHQCDYCVMEFKLIENKEPFCGICFLNAGNKKTVCLDENHFNQNKLFFIFTLILFYENN